MVDSAAACVRGRGINHLVHPSDARAQRRLEPGEDALDLLEGVVVDATLQRGIGGARDDTAGVAQLGQALAERVAPGFELREACLQCDAQLQRRLAAAASLEVD